MNDERDELRRLLRERAEGMTTRAELPPAVLGRARRRMTRNAIAVLALVGILMVGAISGVRAFAPGTRGRSGGIPNPTTTPSQHRTPSSHPTPSPSPSPSPSPHVVSCPAGQLRVTAS